MIDTAPLANHSRIALHYSGGKDSMAVALLLRPYWERLTFYHVDTGDLFPEMRESVAAMEKRVPHFRRIETDARGWIESNAPPSDLIPMTATQGGVYLGGKPMVDRYTCCWHNIMKPMHERMLADGMTLVIRGTKRCDTGAMAVESGDTSMGYEVWLPIQEWSHADVFAYLAEQGTDLCRLYEGRVNAPECARCPAWWNEGRASYLRKYHPDLLPAYAAGLRAVAAEIMPVMATLRDELAAVEG